MRLFLILWRGKAMRWKKPRREFAVQVAKPSGTFLTKSVRQIWLLHRLINWKNAVEIWLRSQVMLKRKCSHLICLKVVLMGTTRKPSSALVFQPMLCLCMFLPLLHLMFGPQKPMHYANSRSTFSSCYAYVWMSPFKIWHTDLKSVFQQPQEYLTDGSMSWGSDWTFWLNGQSSEKQCHKSSDGILEQELLS